MIATEATVTWPASGQPPTSTTALFVPYRPAQLTATVPCRALQVGGDVTVLATGPPGDGLVIRTGGTGPELLLDSRTVPLRPVGNDCRITVAAAADGVTVTDGGGQTTRLADEPVPKVFALRTDLNPELAQGITVTARTASVFATSPTTVKFILIVVQLLAVGVALVLLARTKTTTLLTRFRRTRRFTWRVVGVDVAVLSVLLGWAVIGPLAVDDGWATMIARTFSATGEAGNYYRWWNASETPFAFSQQSLSLFTYVSLSPLWLRLPSTLLAVATWFVLSRGVLGAALPVRSRTARVRLLAAVFLLAAWLPFNLGVRPESYVAFGVTTLLALLWRARTPATLGWAALVVGLTVPISPTSVVLAAPLVVFAPRAVRVLRAAAGSRRQLIAYALSLCCVASVALTVIFADATWDALVTATDWHSYFGPSLPWYQEPDRYRYLLGQGQQGSFAKRLPVLLSAALLPVVALLYAGQRRGAARSAARLAAVVVVALLLLSLGPSKWSYHYGALAGLFAAFVAVAVVFLIDHARGTAVNRSRVVIGVGGGLLVALAAALAFAGSNAWWLPAVYDVPWPAGPVRPLGVPLDSPALWIGVLVGMCVVTGGLARGPARARVTRAAVAGPAVLATLAAAMAVVILVVSFMWAPIRRPSASLALANLHRLTGHSGCGLADDIEVLQDGDVLAAVTPPDASKGFVAQEGFSPDSPPPDEPGSGMTRYVWGSRGSTAAASVTTPWFALPELGSGRGVTVSVSGRTGDGSTLTFEFGRDDPAARSVQTLADVTPPDPIPPGDDPDRPPWRAIAVDTGQIPPEADRVRLRAADARTDPADWFAFTGPRLHSAIGLSAFLASHGPVLIAWPMPFLFPCVRNIVRVAHGLAQAPRSVVVSPGPWFTEPMDQSVGGDFAALAHFGRLYEVPTRVIGHPELDWGALLVSADQSARDAYDVRITDVSRAGHAGDRRDYQVEPEK